jgi:hypothetical protein
LRWEEAAYDSSVERRRSLKGERRESDASQDGATVGNFATLTDSLLTRRSIFALLDFLIGGSIGYIASYFAIRRLYGSIRVD